MTVRKSNTIFVYTLIFLAIVNLPVRSAAQCTPPPGAVSATANTIYYAGGSCVFYDSLCNPLLAVPAGEALWSCSPAKTRWVVVTPASGGYYEFPNYTGTLPQINLTQYMQPLWKSDTIFNELILLTGIGSTAKLVYKPDQILAVKNYDYTLSFVEGADFSVDGRTLTQLAPQLSATYAVQPGSGLLNTQHTSWINVTYIPDRSDWGGQDLFAFQGDQLPNTMAKLKNRQPVVIQALGMSITAGLNVSGFAGDPNNFTPTVPFMRGYMDMFAESLKRHYGSQVALYNSACGGKTAAWADQYCEAMVNPNNPDLVVIDMGMNDIWGTAPASFKSSVQSCIQKIKSECPQAEFVLLANMLPDISGLGAPPNGATTMYSFRDKLKELETLGVVCLDITTASDTIYARKGAQHCTANALHPNDFLARWYAQGLFELIAEGDPIPATGKTYYVNQSGSNGDGLSPASAWTTLARVNAAILQPGDTVLFEGGALFIGNIELDQLDGNDPLNPIRFSSYGPGKATIKTTVQNKSGFLATNTQGVHLENLIFEGPGISNQAGKDGILFFTNNPNGYLSNIQIEQVTVHGFGYCGIRFYSDYLPSVKAGYKNVIIDNCEVFNCRENGIVTIGYDNQNSTNYQHHNIRVTNTRVHDITGYPAPNHKGSGIVLSQADSVLIERCEVFNTGMANTACGGPGGIWVYSANKVTIQFCESHHNKSGGQGGCDGLGFDLDGGVTNSTIQYCYSHDNDGPGFLLGNFWGARPWKNNTVRYNVSIQDARTNNSPVTLFTAPGTVWDGLNFYNNTIIVSPSDSNHSPEFSAFQMTDYGNSMENIGCFNNIFQTKGGVPLLSIPAAFTAQNPAFIGNLYWPSDGPFTIIYGMNEYNTLDDFRLACPACENLQGTNAGLHVDPLLLNVDAVAPTLYPLDNDSLTVARLSDNSPAVDAGLDLTTLFGVDASPRDFWNGAVPFGTQPDIGAYEWWPPINTTTNYALSKPLEVSIYPNPGLDQVAIILHALSPEICKLTVCDPTGKLVFHQTCQSGVTGQMTFQITTSTWRTGAYIFRIEQGADVYQGRFIIAR
jgi:lysophospholipase L1-like esterase